MLYKNFFFPFLQSFTLIFFFINFPFKSILFAGEFEENKLERKKERM